MESPKEENSLLDFESPAKKEYHLSESTIFYEEVFEDEVFLDDSQSSGIEASSDIPDRVRRTSDVIDCVGGVKSPIHAKRHSYPSFSKVVYSAISKATNIRELNKSRHTELATESFDLGYSSPGAQSSSKSDKGTWFRFSTSTDGDSVDARPTDKQTSNNNKEPSDDELTGPSVEATMPVIKDSTRYNMDHEYRGIAIIINNDIFNASLGLPLRDGSWKDVEDLLSMFYLLNYKVEVWNNMQHVDINIRLAQLALKDHSRHDSLAIAVLTHGIGSSFISAKDNLYTVEALWEPFTAEKCTTLAGKPKFFFIQACRGEKLDYGVILKNTTEVDSSASSYKIPSYADFLIVFSTYEGHYSFRHPENGTWFIQSLCTEINKHDLSTIDFLSLMTRVSRRVALDNESYNPEFPWFHMRKQIPTIHSMLIRDVFFTPKKQPPPEPLIF